MHKPEAIQFSSGRKRPCSGFWLWAPNSSQKTLLPESTTWSRGWVLENSLVHGLYVVESTLCSSRNLGASEEVSTLIQGWCDSYLWRVRCLEFWLRAGWNVHRIHSVGVGTISPAFLWNLKILCTYLHVCLQMGRFKCRRNLSGCCQGRKTTSTVFKCCRRGDSQRSVEDDWWVLAVQVIKETHFSRHAFYISSSFATNASQSCKLK